VQTVIKPSGANLLLSIISSHQSSRIEIISDTYMYSICNHFLHSKESASVDHD
jgi:hypothetical protein